MKFLIPVFLLVTVLTLAAIALPATQLAAPVGINANSRQATGVRYACTPCGYDCDGQEFTAPGKCPHCGMQLVDKASITFASLSPSDICQYIHDHPDAILLDVRTNAEFEGHADPNFGTLKNAINIPVDDLASRLSELDKYKHTKVLIYCSHGHRSAQASYQLILHGFTDVTNMAGGMSVVHDAPCKK